MMERYKWQPKDEPEPNLRYWKPHPGPQTRALQATDFELLMGGARGGTKTESSLAVTLTTFKHKPELLPQYRELVVRKNSTDLEEWLDRAARFYYSVGGKRVGKTLRFDSGALIRTGHLKDDNAYTKYLGHEYHRIKIEELTLIPKEINYLQLIASCRSTVPGLTPQVFATTNPGEIGHVWVAQRWGIQGKPPYGEIVTKSSGNRTRRFIPATVEDNPTLMKYDPEYVAFLESLPEPLRSAWRNGDWSVFAGQFFAKLSQTIHACVPFDVPSRWPLTAALDYGETAPTAFGLYTRDGDVTYRIGEYYNIDSSASKHAKNILDFCLNNKYTNGRLPDVVYADPSMWTKTRLDEWSVESPADKFIEQGLNLKPANNDRINGWRACRDAIDWYKSDDDKWIRKPAFQYFEGQSPNFEMFVPTLQTHKINVEDVIKCDTDHAADEWRYHMIAVRPRIILKSNPKLEQDDLMITAGVRDERF